MHVTAPLDARARPEARAWIVLGILCFVYVITFLDRQLLSILAKPIQDDLGVTDGQIGLISGLYFALFYCVLAIPVGWFADRVNRVLVVSIGTALSLYNLGPPLGLALGVAFGASIAAAYDWRTAFMLLGAVGIVTAVVTALIVHEPVRGGLDTAAAHPGRHHSGRRAGCSSRIQSCCASPSRRRSPRSSPTPRSTSRRCCSCARRAFYLSPSVALVQETVRPQERVLGAASDFLKPSHPEHALQLAFYTLVPFYVLAVLCFLWLARAFRADARDGVSA